MLNFDYNNIEPPASTDPLRTSLLSSSFITLVAGKITDISNDVLVELRRKRFEIIQEDMSILLLPAVFEYIEKIFADLIEEKGSNESIVLPFLNVEQQIIPLRVQF